MIYARGPASTRDLLSSLAGPRSAAKHRSVSQHAAGMCTQPEGGDTNRDRQRDHYALAPATAGELNPRRLADILSVILDHSFALLSVASVGAGQCQNQLNRSAVGKQRNAGNIRASKEQTFRRFTSASSITLSGTFVPSVAPLPGCGHRSPRHISRTSLTSQSVTRTKFSLASEKLRPAPSSPSIISSSSNKSRGRCGPYRPAMLAGVDGNGFRMKGEATAGRSARRFSLASFSCGSLALVVPDDTMRGSRPARMPRDTFNLFSSAETRKPREASMPRLSRSRRVSVKARRPGRGTEKYRSRSSAEVA
jgi:hypothetical protein